MICSEIVLIQYYCIAFQAQVCTRKKVFRVRGQTAYQALLLLSKSLIVCKCVFIAAFAHKRVRYICKRHYSRLQGNIFAAYPVGITLAVITFMVMQRTLSANTLPDNKGFSMLVNSNFNMKNIQRYARHASFEQTANTYSHLYPGAESKMSECISKALALSDDDGCQT